MKTVFKVFLILFSSAGFSQSKFEFPKNQNKVSIPFQLISNLIFIPIEVNGVKLTFLLDTGVDETVLLSVDDQQEVSLNNVQSIQLQGLGTADAANALISKSNKLTVGGLVDFHHTIYIVLDQEFNFSENVGIPVNGIIGYNFFKDNIVKIDYDKKRLYVFQNQDRSHRRIQKKYSKIPITIERNKPYVTAEVTAENTEEQVKLLVDNGNSDAVWLFETSPAGANLRTKMIKDYLGKGFSGDIFGKRTRIKSFELGDFKFDLPLIAIPNSESIKSATMVKDRSGSIGSETLRRFTVVFDYPNSAIYLKPNSHFSEPFSYNMSGLEIQHDGLQWVKETVRLQSLYEDNGYSTNGDRLPSEFKYKFVLKPTFAITSVREDSPAEKAGLKKGDKIARINSHSANQYSLEQINDILKSEAGRIIEIEVDRNGFRIKTSFQLEKVL